MIRASRENPPPTRITINGAAVQLPPDSRINILDLIRNQLGLTEAKRGCIDGACGTCTVLRITLRDGQPRLRPVPACQLWSDQLTACHLVTLEALRPCLPSRISEAVDRHHCSPCGFCRTGLIISLTALGAAGQIHQPEVLTPTLRSHLCRCTGYGAWHRAVEYLQQTAPDMTAEDLIPAELLTGPLEEAAVVDADAEAHLLPGSWTIERLADAEDTIYGWTALLAAWMDWIPWALHAVNSLSDLYDHPVFGPCVRTSMLACGIQMQDEESAVFRFPKLERPITFVWERAYLSARLQDDLILALHTKRKGARLTAIAIVAGGFEVETRIIAAAAEPLEETHINDKRRHAAVTAIADHLSHMDTRLGEIPFHGVIIQACQRLFDQVDDTDSPWPKPA